MNYLATGGVHPLDRETKEDIMKEEKILICPKCNRRLMDDEIDWSQEKLKAGIASFRCDVCKMLWPFGHGHEKHETQQRNNITMPDKPKKCCPKCESDEGYERKFLASGTQWIDCNGEIYDTEIHTYKNNKTVVCLDCGARIKLKDL